MKFTRLALAMGLLPGVTCAADAATDDVYAMTPLVVTSGRQAEPLPRATAATTVFTRKDIDRLQPRSVGELLERVPGVTVSRTGGSDAAGFEGEHDDQHRVRESSCLESSPGRHERAQLWVAQQPAISGEAHAHAHTISNADGAGSTSRRCGRTTSRRIRRDPPRCVCHPAAPATRAVHGT